MNLGMQVTLITISVFEKGLSFLVLFLTFFDTTEWLVILFVCHELCIFLSGQSMIPASFQSADKH
jgi:hypothetical protein